MDRANANQGQRGASQDHQAAVADREGDEAVDHGAGGLQRDSRQVLFRIGPDFFSQPLQQMNTGRPSTISLTGAPIDPSGSSVTGQSF